MSEPLAPLHVFRFALTFEEPTKGGSGAGVPVCNGAFSEVSGLEATMEPMVIREGGRSYGAIQRAGPVTFSTVILKRGITTGRDLWKWFSLLNGGAFAHRLNATITIYQPPTKNPTTEVERLGTPAMKWKLLRCMPIKFKIPDLDAKSTEVGIEELHLAHEGLSLETGT